MKKACSLFGIGLHLYSDNHVSESSQRTTPNRRTPRRNQPRPGNGGNGGDPDRLSQRQLSSIWSLGRRLGLGADEIRQRSVQEYGVVPEFLSRSDGAEFLAKLSEQIGGGVR